MVRQSRRGVPLSKGTVKSLSKHRVQQGKEKLLHGEGYNPENLMFCKQNGKKLPYQDARESFERFCRYTDLPYIKPHGLRHTHASVLFAKGRSVSEVADRLGDDPVTIMQTYSHMLPGMQTEIVNTIEHTYDDENDRETIMKTHAHALPGMPTEMAKAIKILHDDEISK